MNSTELLVTLGIAVTTFILGYAIKTIRGRGDYYTETEVTAKPASLKPEGYDSWADFLKKHKEDITKALKLTEDQQGRYDTFIDIIGFFEKTIKAFSPFVSGIKTAIKKMTGE